MNPVAPQGAPTLISRPTELSVWSHSRSRLWASAAILGGLVLALYGEVLQNLARDWWNDPDASYGLLIPPIACYLSYLNRERTFSKPAQFDSKGVWLTILACLIYMTGKLGAEFFLTRFSLIVLLGGMAWTFWGLTRTRTVVFPLLLLATSIPLPALIYNRIAVPLQLVASSVAAGLIRLSGESVFQDGNILQLPHITLGVAEACSGLHSLSSLVVASIILGFTECTHLWTRLMLVSLSIPLAIGVNVFRVTGTALLADYDERYATGFYHSFSGWLVFVGGFGLLWVLAKGLSGLGERWSVRA
jgi:exosortase